jgi:hypothetical protein
MAATRHPLRADEYRARARDAELAGEATPLAEVRRKHELAAATWHGLADAEEARAAERERRLPTPAEPVSES